MDSLPASVEALAGFLTELAEAGKKVATIQRHAAAIAKAHQLASLESPTADSKVKVLLKGIVREKQVQMYQKALCRLMGPFAILTAGTLLLATTSLVEQVFGHVVRVASIGIEHAALGQIQRQAAPAGLLGLRPGMDIKLEGAGRRSWRRPAPSGRKTSCAY